MKLCDEFSLKLPSLPALMNKVGFAILLLLVALCYSSRAFAEGDSSNVNDTADSVKIVKIDTTKPPPPDSAYIARASDPNWWKRKVENKAFNVGEYLKFQVRYGMIRAGTAIIEIADTIDYNGAKCFKVVSTARSNAFVSTFYKVRDTVFSYIDYDGIYSHYFSKRLNEGKYHKTQETFFDQRRHLAITGEDTIRTYSFVQDAFSALYYARTLELEEGADLKIDNHTDRKNYPLKVIVHGRDSVEVPAGKFDCIVVEPVMRAEGIFQAKGSIKIWLTNDRYKIPVKMQTEVFFLGSIHADLVEFKRGVFPDELKQVEDERK